MIQILLFCLTVASWSVVQICSLTKDDSKAVYELYSGESYGKMTSLMDKIFHQCSLEDDCNFVAKNTKHNSFKKYSDEADLPKDRKTFMVFKETLINFEIEETGKYSCSTFLQNVSDLKTFVKLICSLMVVLSAWFIR